jgi:hypothetical protein
MERRVFMERKNDIVKKIKEMSDMMNNFTEYMLVSKKTADQLGIKDGMLADKKKVKISNYIPDGKIILVDRKKYEDVISVETLI